MDVFHGWPPALCTNTFPFDNEALLSIVFSGTVESNISLIIFQMKPLPQQSCLRDLSGLHTFGFIKHFCAISIIYEPSPYLPVLKGPGRAKVTVGDRSWSWLMSSYRLLKVDVETDETVWTIELLTSTRWGAIASTLLSVFTQLWCFRGVKNVKLRTRWSSGHGWY